MAGAYLPLKTGRSRPESGVRLACRAKVSTRRRPPAEHARLVREIEAHDYRYYVLDDPIVTDAAVRRAHRSCARSRRSTRSSSPPSRRRSASAARRAPRSSRCGTSAGCSRSTTRTRPRTCCEFHRRVMDGLRDGRRRRASASSRSSTARASRSSTRAASSCRRPRAATAPRARTSRRTSAPSAAFPRASPHQGKLTLRGEVLIYRKDLETHERRARGGGPRALREPAQRRRRRGAHDGPARGRASARCAPSSTRPSRARRLQATHARDAELARRARAARRTAARRSRRGRA